MRPHRRARTRSLQTLQITTITVQRISDEEQKLLQPLLVDRSHRPLNTEERGSILSRALLLFVIPTMKKSAKLDANMQIEDLEPIAQDEGAEKVHRRFCDAWGAHRLRHPDSAPSLVRVLMKCCWGDFALMTLASAVDAVGPFSTIVVMDYISSWIETPTQPDYYAVIFALTLLVLQVVCSVGAAQAARISSRMAVRFQSMLNMELARKSVHLSVEGKKSVGGDGSPFPVVFHRLKPHRKPASLRSRLERSGVSPGRCLRIFVRVD